MMYLKPSADFMAFLRKVKSCEGGVFLNTPNGDSLNLRSALCQMIAVIAIKKLRNTEGLEIQCENPKDYLLLGDFLSE